MKHIKLFESYIKKVNFNIPPLFVIPNGVSRDKMFIVSTHTGDGDLTNFLADYELLEEIYDVMNLKRIQSALGAYAALIKSQSIDKSADTEYQKATRTHTENYARQSMNGGFSYDNISIRAMSPKFGPPVDVWFGSANDSEVTKSIKAMIKKAVAECKGVCGNPAFGGIGPGDEDADHSGDDNTVYFDENREGNMTDVVFDKNSKYDEFLDWSDSEESYYIEFPKIGTCVIFPHPANESSISDITGDKLICDARQILYKYMMEGNFDTYKQFSDGHDFLTDDQIDEIMGTLVDRGVSMRIINTLKKSTPKYREQNPREDEVEYKQFIKYSVNSEKYYVQEYLDASAKYNYYGKTREGYKKELEDSFNREENKPVEFSNYPVMIPITICDEVMKKLPRNQSEFNSMIDSTPKSEIDNSSAMRIELSTFGSSSYGDGKDRNASYIGEISMNTKVRPFFPKSDPVKGRGKVNPGVFKGITPEMIRKATPFQVYCLCYYNVNILK